MRILSILLVIIAGPAAAQSACPADPPPPDPCLVGHWIGQNDAMQQVAAMLEQLAPRDATRTVMTDVPALLGLSIYPDGFYHTIPIHQTVAWEDVSERDVVTGVLDLNMPTETGHLMTLGGSLSFCTTGTAPVALRAQGTSTEGRAETTLFPAGAASCHRSAMAAVSIGCPSGWRCPLRSAP
jgi:hypothetical protein